MTESGSFDFCLFSNKQTMPVFPPVSNRASAAILLAFCVDREKSFSYSWGRFDIEPDDRVLGYLLSLERLRSEA